MVLTEKRTGETRRRRCQQHPACRLFQPSFQLSLRAGWLIRNHVCATEVQAALHACASDTISRTNPPLFGERGVLNTGFVSEQTSDESRVGLWSRAAGGGWYRVNSNPTSPQTINVEADRSNREAEKSEKSSNGDSHQGDSSADESSACLSLRFSFVDGDTLPNRVVTPPRTSS